MLSSSSKAVGRSDTDIWRTRSMEKVSASWKDNIDDGAGVYRWYVCAESRFTLTK